MRAFRTDAISNCRALEQLVSQKNAGFVPKPAEAKIETY